MYKKTRTKSITTTNNGLNIKQQITNNRLTACKRLKPPGGLNAFKWRHLIVALYPVDVKHKQSLARINTFKCMQCATTENQYYYKLTYSRNKDKGSRLIYSQSFR